MGTFTSLDEARAFFEHDRFATENGMRIDALTDTECICSVKLTEHHKNALGGVMGGVIYTLADLAFAALCNHLHRPSVALNVDLNFLSSSKGSRLVACCRCIKNGRTTGVYQVTVTDDLDKTIALFTGTAYKLSAN